MSEKTGGGISSKVSSHVKRTLGRRSIEGENMTCLPKSLALPEIRDEILHFRRQF